MAVSKAKAAKKTRKSISPADVDQQLQALRIAFCLLIPVVQIAAFELWRGPAPGRLGATLVGALLNAAGIYALWVAMRPDRAASEVVAPTSFFRYDRFRFLWAATGILTVALGAYVLHDPLGGASGGSWLGYTLGSVCAAIVAWLMYFGIRKRQYDSRGAPLRAWLSGHVYLGMVLLALVPLHSAFQFAWNLHTLAFVLVTLVVLTGFAGVGFYTQVPAPMTRNRPGKKLEALISQVAEVDSQCRVQAEGLPDTLGQAIERSVTDTVIGGSLLEQLSGRVASNPTKQAIEAIQAERASLPSPDAQRASAENIVELLVVKQRLLQRIQKDIRYKALLDAWLLLHVPLAFGACAAIVLHVVVVLYYR